MTGRCRGADGPFALGDLVLPSGEQSYVEAKRDVASRRQERFLDSVQELLTWENSRLFDKTGCDLSMTQSRLRGE